MHAPTNPVPGTVTGAGGVTSGRYFDDGPVHVQRAAGALHSPPLRQGQQSHRIAEEQRPALHPVLRLEASPGDERIDCMDFEPPSYRLQVSEEDEGCMATLSTREKQNKTKQNTVYTLHTVMLCYAAYHDCVDLEDTVRFYSMRKLLFQMLLLFIGCVVICC